MWCRGFGPIWPVLVEAVSFQSDGDSKPYLVQFFGDGGRAWVSQNKLLAWDARKPQPKEKLLKRMVFYVHVGLWLALWARP